MLIDGLLRASSFLFYKMQPLSVGFFLLFMHLTSAFNQRIVSANGTFAGRNNYTIISVCNGATWGEWTWPDMCPERSYANGFSIKMEDYGGQFSDDTSVNGIRLYCSSNRTSNIIYTIESDSGKFGKWGNITWCPKGSVLNSFQLKVELPHGHDATAVNNIKFRCNKGAIIDTVGGRFGDYDMWSATCYKGGICGLQTRQEQYKGVFADDTALNDVHFYCCE